MSIQKIKELGIPVVQAIQPFNSLESLVGYTKSLEGVEGFIVAFENGHKIKIKADQYVRIHKTIDRVVFDRNIVQLILKGEIDDALALLPQAQATRVRDFESRFWRAFKIKEDYLLAIRDIANQLYADDRKRIAIEFVPTLSDKEDAQFIFRMLDNNPPCQLLLQHIEKNASSNTKWDACAKWLGMANV
jgi:RNA ligase